MYFCVYGCAEEEGNFEGNEKEKKINKTYNLILLKEIRNMPQYFFHYFVHSVL